MNESNDPNSREHDKDLHDEGISRLYRQLPDESPSADSDALIRAAARREVGAGPQRRLVRLQKLLATAASLVLGVALVVQWQYREPEKLAEALATAPTHPAPAPLSDTARNDFAPAAAKPAAPQRNVSGRLAVAAEEEAEEKASAADAAAGASAPLQSLAAAPAPAAAFVPQEPAMTPPDMESLKKSRMEEQLADADMAAKRERQLSAARETARAAAPAAPTANIAALRQDALRQEKAKADMAPALAAAGAENAVSATTPYRNAMRQQQWRHALAELEKLAFTNDGVLLVDHDILRRLVDNKDVPNCSRLATASLGAQTPLCVLLQNLAQGKSAAPDAFTQLEKAGLLSGEFDYRRPALRQLLQP